MIKTSSSQLRKIFAIVAASLILPVLAHAKDIQWDKNEKADKGEKSDKGDKATRMILEFPTFQRQTQGGSYCPL